MQLKPLIPIIACLSAFAQTTMYVPTGQTRCVASATNATPIVISTAGCDNASLASATPVPVAHGWTNGTVIVLAGVEGNTAANGTRVATNVTATTAELYDLAAAPVAGNGAFLRYTDGVGTSYPTVASGVQVTLKDHPRVWLDGSGGTLTSTLCTSGRADCKAVASNPAYAAMKTAIDGRVLTADTAAPSETTIAQFQGGDMGYLGGVALMYQSTGITTYRDKTIAALNNIDKYTKGFGCVSEQLSGCGDSITLDYGSKYMWNMAQAYSIVRSGMTPLERTTFANKMLNDVDDSCTSRFYAGVGTVNYTLYGRTITGTGTQWLTNADTTQRIAAGDSIAYTTGCTSGYCSAMTMIVKSVESDTSLTIQTSPTGGFVAANVVNGPFWIGKPWASGNCGLVNFISYSGYAPVASGKSHGNAYLLGVPSSFGGASVYSTSIKLDLYNQNITKGLGFLALAIALADDDPRAQAMLQRMVFWWKDVWYPSSRAWNTGPAQITAKYYATRVNPFTIDFAVQLRNSFYESSMDFTGGTWLKTPLSLWVYGYNRAANSGTRWGGAAPVVMTPDHWKGGLGAAYLQPTTDEAKAWNHILRNYTGYYLPAETMFGYANMLGYPDNYLYTDPTAPAADPNTTLPLSRNMTVSDYSPSGEGTGVVLSRTGWLADSSIFEIHAIGQSQFSYLYGLSYSGDPASYKIFKRHYLLAEDYGKGIQPTFSAYCDMNERTNYVRIGAYGATSPSLLNRANFPTQRQYVRTPRYWSDPGDAATYAMVDYALAYQTTAQITFAHRHFAHFKKPGRAEYVIAADAVRTSGGQHKITFLHYPNNGQTGVFENGTTPWPANGNEGNTTFSTDSVISDGPASRILTKVLKPGGATSLRIYTDNPDGSYTGAVDPAKGPLGGAGQTFRVSICASADGATCDTSNTKMNAIVAHRVVDGITETANPVALLSTIDSNFIGAQVDDGANSVVAVFPSEGSTLSSASFTSTHADSAQYLVSGLTEGLWAITRDGSILASSVLVGGSGTAYWEATAGAYSLARSGAGPLSVATGSVPDAVRNAAYSYSLSAQGGTPPYTTWTVTSGTLPTGVVLSTSGLVWGTPTAAAGAYSFTAQVTDSVGATASKAFTLNVTVVALSVSTASLPAATTGVAYNQGLSAIGGTPPYTWAVTVGSLPAGLTLTGNTISGTPSGTGTSSFTVRATDAVAATATKALSIVVSSTVVPLAITTTSLPSGTVGEVYAAPITATGGTAPYTFAVTSGSIPGLTLATDGSLSGTPTTAGSYSLTVRVTDNVAATASVTLPSTIISAPEGESLVTNEAVGVAVNRRGTSAVVTFRLAGLAYDSACQVDAITIGLAIATGYLSPGGLSVRQAPITGLTPGSVYHFRVKCGADGGTAQNVAATAAVSGNTAVPINLWCSSNVTVNYGLTLASSVTATHSAGRCSTSLSLAAGVATAVRFCRGSNCGSPIYLIP